VAVPASANGSYSPYGGSLILTNDPGSSDGSGS
jgi:hypothetical protein